MEFRSCRESNPQSDLLVTKAPSRREENSGFLRSHGFCKLSRSASWAGSVKVAASAQSASSCTSVLSLVSIKTTCLPSHFKMPLVPSSRLQFQVFPLLVTAALCDSALCETHALPNRRAAEGESQAEAQTSMRTLLVPSY